MDEKRRSRTLREALRDKEFDGWLETIGVVLLALASFAAAWSGYQAANWGGTQSTLYSQASSKRMESFQARTQGELLALVDIETFDNYVNAYAVNNAALMQFYERRFSERLAPAVTAWLATDPLNAADAPASPFDMKEYQIPEIIAAEEISREANVLFDKGTYAGEQSLQYVLNTVYLATVLFFSGIATKIKGRSGRIALIGLGALLLMYGIGHLLELHIRSVS